MDTLPVKPERLAQLEEFARRRGKSTAEALDDALADYLEWGRQDYQKAVEAVRPGQARHCRNIRVALLAAGGRRGKALVRRSPHSHCVPGESSLALPAGS